MNKAARPHEAIIGENHPIIKTIIKIVMSTVFEMDMMKTYKREADQL